VKNRGHGAYMRYKYCMESDEVTLPHLQKANNGQDFLKYFMLDDASSIPSEPIFLPSPRWDSMMGKNENICQMENKAWPSVSETSSFVSFSVTTAYNGSFLFSKLRSFHGHPPYMLVAGRPPSHILYSCTRPENELLGELMPSL
jgi:hypothetical protein